MKKLFRQLLMMGVALGVAVGPGLSIPFDVSAVSSQGATELASVAYDGSLPNNPSGGAKVSQDGRYVYFGSNASNLVPSDTNNAYDIFVRDRLLGTTTRLSLNSAGEQADKGVAGGQFDISDDGRYLVFASNSTNLSSIAYSSYSIYVRDLQAGVTSLVFARPYRDSSRPVISGDGRYIAFNTRRSSDLNVIDVYVYDRIGFGLTLVSNGLNGVASNGSSPSPDINYDGSVVVFDSLLQRIWLTGTLMG